MGEKEDTMHFVSRLYPLVTVVTTIISCLHLCPVCSFHLLQTPTCCLLFGQQFMGPLILTMTISVRLRLAGILIISIWKLADRMTERLLLAITGQYIGYKSHPVISVLFFPLLHFTPTCHQLIPCGSYIKTLHSDQYLQHLQRTRKENIQLNFTKD